MKWLSRWLTRRTLIKISKYAIALTAVLSAIFAGFTIYGSKVGNFVVNIERERNINLALYKSEELIDPQSRLVFPGMTEQTNSTLDNVPDDIDIGYGDKNDYTNRRYIAYSFLIRNESDVAVDYNMTIEIKKVTLNVDSAIRIMIIANGTRNIYAKPKEYPIEDIGKPEDFPYMTTPFLSPVKVCDETINNFAGGASMKYTVVIWLEGHDNECVDAIKGGSLKMEMNFTAY